MVASMPRETGGNRACGRVLCPLTTHLVQELNAGTVRKIFPHFSVNYA